MHRKRVASPKIFGALIAAVCLAGITLAAQTAASRNASASMPPRGPDGHPDISGIWEHNAATPLERPDELAGRALPRIQRPLCKLTIGRCVALALIAGGDERADRPGRIKGTRPSRLCGDTRTPRQRQAEYDQRARGLVPRATMTFHRLG